MSGPLSKRKRRLDSLEAAQGAPRDPRRDSRGERSPLLPLETRPDSPCLDYMLSTRLILASGLSLAQPLACYLASPLESHRVKKDNSPNKDCKLSTYKGQTDKTTEWGGVDDEQGRG